MADKKEKSSPMNFHQKETLVEFISSREEMYSGKLTQTYTREKMAALWTELSALLNSIPGGSCKDWRQWRKTWVDLKKNTKSKISLQKKYSQGTGGGPPQPSSSMTSIDAKIYNILTPVAVNGIEPIFESLVDDNEAEAEGEQLQQAIQEDEVEREIPIINIDHNYNNTPSTSTTTQRKRVTKTSRLSDSIKNNADFLNLQKEDMESKRWYRKRKIEIMEAECNNKKKIEERKMKILEDISNSLCEIKETFQEVKENIQ